MRETSRIEKEAALEEAYMVGRSLPPLPGSTQYVPGVGDALSRVILVGEAPGASEDREGEPFVGKAGKLLTDSLENLGIPRESVYIVNTVGYRPPNNRKPTAEEISLHFPILNRVVEIINPIAMLLLGATALKAVTGSSHISSARGKELPSPWSCLVMATYHPSYVDYGGITKKDWSTSVEVFFETALERVLQSDQTRLKISSR